MSSAGPKQLRLALGEVDLVRRQLAGPAGPVHLTSKDVEVLGYLAERAGTTVSRAELEQAVWGLAPGVQSEAVPVAMRRLRSKIEPDPAAPRNLQTVYGVGWVLHLSEAPELPAERDAFVGRAVELATLADQWASGARAIQLVGPGGVGKTRLARRAAADLGGTVRLVELTGPSAELVRAVAEAWSVPVTGADPTGQVGHALAARGPTLTVLDDLAPTVELEATVGRWLDAAPEARFLLTLARPAPLEGAQVVTVGPLPRDQGIALLRVRATHPTDDAQLGLLVDHLDGLPLALELAATVLPGLSVPELIARLTAWDDTMLRDEARSVRAAVLDTWASLSAGEQQAVAQLTSFADAFSLADAEGVLSLEDEAPTATVLTRLVAAGVVVRRGRRHRLLRPLRGVAWAHLSAPERHAVEVRHGRWATHRADDLGELRAAVVRAVERDDAEVARGAALAAWALVRHRGPMPLGVTLLELAVQRVPRDFDVLLALSEALGRSGDRERERERVEAALGVAADSGQRARALNRSGWVALRAGELDHAAETLARALVQARDAGDPEEVARVTGNLAALEDERGNPEAAIAHLDDALARFSGSSLVDAGTARVKLGLVHARLGEVPDALFQLRRAVEDFEATDHAVGRAIALTNLAQLTATHGDPEEALEQLREVLALHRGLGHRSGMAVAHGSLGLHLVELGRLDEARPHLDAARELHQAAGSPRLEAMALCWKAAAALLQDRLSTAERHLARATSLLAPIDAPRSHALLASVVANLDLGRGRAAEALEHLDRALGLLRDAGFDALGWSFEVERARALLAMGRADEALPVAEEALGNLEGPREVAMARCVLAEILAARGEPARAQSALDEARAVVEAQGIGPTSPLGAAVARAEQVWAGSG